MGMNIVVFIMGIIMMSEVRRCGIVLMRRKRLVGMVIRLPAGNQRQGQGKHCDQWEMPIHSLLPMR
ncbi:hypothetical protein [Steroidobacter denitrificans]|uniref:hypothetical protein n=1 Tax=Steroidobacter denitrificans TaxID=465721 RepID=UPI001AEF9955|nr:hypothetical protein [Steroidobacter denitrificans]